jgi:hypothetical protein
VLTIPATISTGTASATRDASTITVDADAQTAIGATSISGRYIRLSTTWYFIQSYLAGNITLGTGETFTEDDVTDGSFHIVGRYFELAANAQWLGRFVHMRRRREVVNRAVSILDMTAPERQEVGNGPLVYAEMGRGTNDRIQIEMYPFSTDSETVHYVYWDKPTDLALTDTVPDGIPEYVLMEGALIDLFRYRAAQAANAGRIEEAGYWRNEARAQATSWERDILEAAKADRPVDDISFLMHHLGLAAPFGLDISTARREVWNRDVPWN